MLWPGVVPDISCAPAAGNLTRAVGAPSAQPGGASAATAASPSGAAASAQAASSAAAAQAEDGGEVEGDGAAELAGIDMDVVASEAAAAPARYEDVGRLGAGCMLLWP